jgi:hypothetical protein
VIGLVSCKITVERVAACAGVSSETANAADAAAASANFALRVNFIDPPRGISKSVCGESTCPIGAFGGVSLPELSVLTQQGNHLHERGICNDVRNKEGMWVWRRGDF